MQKCECCGKAIPPESKANPVVPKQESEPKTSTHYPPRRDEFADAVEAFRQNNGRNPRGIEWTMFY